MNYPLLAASFVLAGASFFDGLSTAYFLRNPMTTEQNFLFGLHPSKRRVFVEGALIIGAEITLSLVAAHWKHFLGDAFAFGFAAQSAIHVRNGIRNYRLPLK